MERAPVDVRDAKGPPPGPGRRLLRAGAVVALFAGVVYLEFALFGDQIVRNVEMLRQPEPAAGEAAAAAAGEEGPEPAAPPEVAPPEAGAVLGVEFRPLDRCRPGATCTAVVQARLEPAEVERRVAWRFVVFDQCRDERTELPGGSATAPPGSDRVAELSRLDLPPGRSLAVIAVTTEPAKAAAPPLYTAPDAGC